MVKVLYPCFEPCEGPRIFPLVVDFSQSVQIDVQFLYAQGAGELSQLRTLYIDNSGNGQPVSLFIPVSLQEIDVPANAQGYVSLMAPNPPLVQFTSSGNIAVLMHLLNFYMPTQFFGNAIYQPPGSSSFLIQLESGAGFAELESGLGLIELETGP